MNIVPVSEIPMPPSIEEVEFKNPIGLYKICKDMEVLCDKSNGIGLSAVQVGLPLKLFVVKFKDHYEYLLNCEYTSVDKSELVESIEGCLSLPGRFFVVKRYPAVCVSGWRLSSNCEIQPHKADYNGLYAVVMQHEIDHHRGVMIDSIGKEYLFSTKNREQP